MAIEVRMDYWQGATTFTPQWGGAGSQTRTNTSVMNQIQQRKLSKAKQNKLENNINTVMYQQNQRT